MTNNIHDMFDNIASSDLKIKDTKEAKARKKRSNLVILSAACLLTFVSAGAYYITNQTSVEVKKSSKVVETEKAPRANAPTTDKNAELPVVLPTWAKISHANAQSEEDKAKIANSLDKTNFLYMTSVYPSVTEGFTSDPNNMYDEDGLPNIYYSTATREDIKFLVVQYLNRLYNPMFGNWIQYQYGKDHKTSNMSDQIYGDMFTDSYIEKNKENMPFYTDKEGNDYGIKWSNNDVSKPRFVGVISEISKLETDDTLNTILVEAIIDMYANTAEGKVHRTLTVNLQLVSTIEKSNPFVINSIDVKEVKK